MTRENISHRVWGVGTQNISLLPGRLTDHYGSYGVGSQMTQLFSRNKSEGGDSNMSLFPGRLFVHTGSYWVVVKWHFQHHATRENIANRVWGGRTQNISLLPERLTVHYGSYGVDSHMTQLFSAEKSEGVGFEHDLNPWSFSVHNGSKYTQTREHYQTQGLRWWDPGSKIIPWETHCP